MTNWREKEFAERFDIGKITRGEPITEPVRIHKGCKGKCTKEYEHYTYVTTNPKAFLAMGFRRCRPCEQFIKTTEMYCPCCRKKMSIK